MSTTAPLTIIIATYYFYPDKTPRAFRAFELAKELAKQGHRITVITRQNIHNLPSRENNDGFTVHRIPSGFLLNKSQNLAASPVTGGSWLKKKVQRLILEAAKLIYLGGRSFEFAFTLSRHFRQNPAKADIVISIGLPVSTHLGVTTAIKKAWLKTTIAIADYGDPYTYNAESGSYRFHKYIEKPMLRWFDHISVPHEHAIPAFLPLVAKEKVRVIPQGYPVKNVRIASYVKHNIPTFAYAGIFYRLLRHPGILFDYLCTLERHFKFVLYTDTSNTSSMALIAPYITRLGKKLEIRPQIPREDCIYELSRYDFLINISNTDSAQVPSKLVDYALTRRPVFHLTQTQMDKNLLNQFLDGNYANETGPKADLNRFDIETVSRQFLSLAAEKLAVPVEAPAIAS